MKGQTSILINLIVLAKQPRALRKQKVVHISSSREFVEQLAEEGHSPDTTCATYLEGHTNTNSIPLVYIEMFILAWLYRTFGYTE